jgi:hypothetical protein
VANAPAGSCDTMRGQVTDVPLICGCFHSTTRLTSSPSHACRHAVTQIRPQPQIQVQVLGTQIQIQIQIQIQVTELTPNNSTQHPSSPVLPQHQQVVAHHPGRLPLQDLLQGRRGVKGLGPAAAVQEIVLRLLGCTVIRVEVDLCTFGGGRQGGVPSAAAGAAAAGGG